MRVLAHRGASGYAPENTFAAFDLAGRMRADGIETDVRATRDGVLVLLHDELVDRTTDGSGPVADLAWEDVARLDAGGWFGPDMAGQRVPRLDDFLDRYLEAIPICLELKAEAAVEAVARLLVERGLARRSDLELTSFSWDAARHLHDALSDLPVGFLTPRFDEGEIERVAAAGLAQICPRANLLTPELVARAHARGLVVRAHGVKTRDDLRRVLEGGADGTTLNWPDWVARSGSDARPDAGA